MKNKSGSATGKRWDDATKTALVRLTVKRGFDDFEKSFGGKAGRPCEDDAGRQLLVEFYR